MKKIIPKISLLLFLICVVLSVIGVHRDTNIYGKENIISSTDSLSENQEDDIKEEVDHRNNSYLNIESVELKNILENIGYITKVIENGDNDFFQSISSDKKVSVNYDKDNKNSSLEVKYTYDEEEDLIKIREDDPLVIVWCEISKLINKEEYKTEFMDFVKNYKELNGKSCKLGSVSIYSQIYGGEFFITIEKGRDGVE